MRPIPPGGILPAVDDTAALAATPHQTPAQAKAEASAAEAQAWLSNPTAHTDHKAQLHALLDRWEHGPQWTGPAYGTPENPAPEDDTE